MLFKLSEVNLPDFKEPEFGEPEPPKKKFDPHVHKTTRKRSRRVTVDGLRLAAAKKCMEDFEEGDELHVIGANSWNTHDLIDVAADITGPAQLWLCVYSVSDSSVRRVRKMKDEGRITEVYAVINTHQARQRPAGALQLVQVAEILSVYPCHAKVYILRGEKRAITISSSANLTACPWLEAATITDGLELADWGIEWIKKALTLSEPFTADSMGPASKAKMLAQKEILQK